MKDWKWKIEKWRKVNKKGGKIIRLNIIVVEKKMVVKLDGKIIEDWKEGENGFKWKMNKIEDIRK